MLSLYLLCTFIVATFGLQIQSGSQNHLQNRHLKVAALRVPPFMEYFCNGKIMRSGDVCPNKNDVAYGGALWELLKLVKQTRNTSFSILKPLRYNFGVCYGENNSTGMIGMVNRAEVDFALGSFLI